MGISGPAVSDRLYALGIRLKPPGYSKRTVEDVNGAEKLRRILAELRVKVREES